MKYRVYGIVKETYYTDVEAESEDKALEIAEAIIGSDDWVREDDYCYGLEMTDIERRYTNE